MNAPENFTLNMQRFIRAPREKVYDAFTTKAGLTAWMGPRGRCTHSAAFPLCAMETSKWYARSDYLAGSSLCAADLFVAPILAGLQSMPEGGRLLAGYPNILRAQDLIRQRQSFRATKAPMAA